MENQQLKDITCKKIAWAIKDFSKLSIKKLYSEVFTISGCACFFFGHFWTCRRRVLIDPHGNDGNDLSIFLDVANASSLPLGWGIYAEFGLILVDQISGKLSEKKEIEHRFNEKESDWGFKSFVPLSILRDQSHGHIYNDTCIIEVEFSVVRSEQTSIELTSCPAYPSLSKESKEVPANLNGELINFKDLGQVEKAFVPLLEEVCQWHPSLIKCQQKRTCRFTEWAFTALGRVLHFLKTKKGTDMTEEACEDLQDLWEELETCRFDLTWLEPHVQSAFGVKKYMERADQVKKLKNDMVALEMEVINLREKLANTEADLEEARKELTKAEEGFVERDMDIELGYGRPLL